MITALVLSTAGCAEHSGAATTSFAQQTRPAAARSVRPVDADPTLTPSDAAGAILIAREGVSAFCRPRLAAPMWVAGLDPFLTLQAASAYGTVDPARIPCMRVTGLAASRGGDAYSQVVSVPTDAGPYGVLLSRASTADAWRVSQLTREASR